MFDLNNNETKFNLPNYINTPLFLYQDERLDKSSLLVASFFYSLHTAHQKITASTNYLCKLVCVKKRQLYNIMNQLETLGYIRRDGFTNRKKLTWVHSIKSDITVTENEQKDKKRNTGAPNCSSVQKQNTSATQCTKLVQSSALNYCNALHTDNKEDTKENKKTSTTKEPSTSFFFSKSTDEKMLDLKLPQDLRTNEEFLTECKLHVDTKSKNPGDPYLKRANTLVYLLQKMKKEGKIFFVSGSKNEYELKQHEESKEPTRKPTHDDFEQYKRCDPTYNWVGKWLNQPKQA